MPDEASCRIIRAFFVTEQIKSKMTRQCDLGQVTFNNKGCENVANLLEEKQVQQRIPHVVFEVVVKTRYGRGGCKK